MAVQQPSRSNRQCRRDGSSGRTGHSATYRFGQRGTVGCRSRNSSSLTDSDANSVAHTFTIAIAITHAVTVAVAITESQSNSVAAANTFAKSISYSNADSHSIPGTVTVSITATDAGAAVSDQRIPHARAKWSER